MLRQATAPNQQAAEDANAAPVSGSRPVAWQGGTAAPCQAVSWGEARYPHSTAQRRTAQHHSTAHCSTLLCITARLCARASPPDIGLKGICTVQHLRGDVVRRPHDVIQSLACGGRAKSDGCDYNHCDILSFR